MREGKEPDGHSADDGDDSFDDVRVEPIAPGERAQRGANQSVLAPDWTKRLSTRGKLARAFIAALAVTVAVIVVFPRTNFTLPPQITRLLTVKGQKTPRELHRQLGRIVWDYVGMSRTADGLKKALTEIPRLRDEFWQNVSVPGEPGNMNKNLEYAGRVADYLEFAELLALDALTREESCGGHFRDDEHFAHAAAWEFTGVGQVPVRHVESLSFEYVKPSQRSYK